MTGLTQVSITARKSIRYIIYFIVFLTVGRILWGFGVTLYFKYFPPGLPPATVRFGKLTKIPFQANGLSAKLNFSLETPNGTFPKDISTQAKVYFMPKINPNLLALDNAKYKAKAMGFDDPNIIQESDAIYKFKNTKYPSTMEMNIVTGTFSISYDLTVDRSIIQIRPPTAEAASTAFKSYLSLAGILSSDLEAGPMIPDYLKLESGALTKVLALSEADVTKVNIFRKPFDNLPSLTNKPGRANVWGMISGQQNRDQEVVAAEYHYYPVDETQFSTYPIITPQEAFAKLQAGKEYIAQLGQYKDGDSLKIRKIYLAYFDPDVASDFYQPIYVFDSSDNDTKNSFIGYVPAVNATYYPED
jgi:hypothetical protein